MPLVRRYPAGVCPPNATERRDSMTRKVADCRDFPSESGCTLTISGEEDEVLTAAIQHAKAVHAHEDNAELRQWLAANLKDEVPTRV
jgi:predicted small metal-binding protein